MHHFKISIMHYTVAHHMHTEKKNTNIPNYYTRFFSLPVNTRFLHKTCEHFHAQTVLNKFTLLF